MNIAKALIGRASCVLALLAVGFGARIASAQSDGVCVHHAAQLSLPRRPAPEYGTGTGHEWGSVRDKL